MGDLGKVTARTRICGFVLPAALNLLALLIALAQFHEAGATVEIAGGRLTWAAPIYLFGQATFLWGMGWCGMIALQFLRLPTRLILGLWCVYFTALFSLLYADYLVVYLYGIHIHEQFLRLATEPGITQDLGLATSSMVKMALTVLLLCAVQVGVFRLSGLLRAVAARRCSRVATIVAVAVPILTFAVWSYSHQVRPVHANADVSAIPFFLPRDQGLQMDGFWGLLGVKRQEEEVGAYLEQNDDSQFEERLAYSEFRRELELPEGLHSKNPLNILVLGAESWRFDMLNPLVMPRLWALAQDRGFVSKGHYSTGNRTPESIFGLFSGLSPFYWKVCRDESLNPPFFDVLKRLGYTNRVFTSSTFAYGGVDEFVFGEHIDLMDVVNTQKSAATTMQWKRRRLEVEDQAIVDHLAQSLRDGKRTERRMDFAYFYVTHYNYYYPDRFEKFTPAMGSDFAAYDFTLRARRQKVLNRYKNSCFYLDHLLGQVFDVLDEQDRWKDTVVVITGDHGEEFFEMGRFGHSVSTNRFQTQVPFVMIFPEHRSIRYSVTSHADLVPTLLSELTILPTLPSMHTGKNLLEFDPRENAALIMNLLGARFPTRFTVVKDDFKLQVVNGIDELVVEKRLDLEDAHLPQLKASRESEAMRWALSQKRFFQKR